MGDRSLTAMQGDIDSCACRAGNRSSTAENVLDNVCVTA